ncbi:hypothetical protein DFH08DRAFT_840300 [Mycena albidolilacea]|uniref:Uncharacterized protein n=1 Tax=Mycena albidolilacea TaxID=1033008 RepID=A0AAD7F2Q8_9AGAR|nr:hypothetical protein DFH08DRAFT_840300 [Mycena albidolilacea]
MQNRPGGSTLPTLSIQTSSDTITGSHGPGAGAEDIDGHEPTVTALKLVPISPESFQRYTRRRTILIAVFFHRTGSLRRNDIRKAGSIFSMNNSSLLMRRHSSLLAWVELQDLLASNSGHIDIFVDLMKESSENDGCGYYLVDHSARIIFWLDPFKMSTSESWKQVPGIDGPSHVKMYLEIEYWRHCTYFSAAMVFSLETMDQLRDTIIFGIGDAMASSTTTQSLPVEHLFRMLTLAKEMLPERIPETGDTTRMNDGSAATVARFMQNSLLHDFVTFTARKPPG